MSKKFIIGASIALVLILGGGVAYYFWNQASADVVTRDFCNGVTGRGWKNCVANAVVLRNELGSRDATKFKRALSNADTLRNYVPGKGTISPSISPSKSVSPSPTVTNADNCTGVMVYTSENFAGTGTCLAPGNYNSEVLLAKGIKNNSIASIKVPAGHLATIYQDENFSVGNASMVVSDDLSTVVRTKVDDPSAIRVFGDCEGAIVYSDPNYTGRYGICLPVGRFDEAIFSTLGLKIDDIDSVKVASGYKVTLFAAKGFPVDYDKVSLTVNTSDLKGTNPYMNDRVNSIIVEKL